jgi:hypothetical protein
LAKLVPRLVMIPAVRGDETTTETAARITIDPAMLNSLSRVIFGYLHPGYVPGLVD